MNNISESLLNSMSILFKNTLDQQKLTRVVEATIIELLDSSIGLYSIKYENQILKAYTNNVAIKYNKDDKIFVLCQDGTLDGKLLIIGAQNPYAGLYTKDTSDIKYTRVADSLITLNEGSDIELCTYQSDMETNLSCILYGENSFSNICNHYLDKYKTFAFQFKVQTNITDVYQRVDGNYGLIMALPFIQNGQSITREYVFDINTMEGDPYNFSTPALQTVYIQFEDGLEFDGNNSPTFKSFVKSFKRDRSITEPDIFISDTEFYPVEVLDESTLSGYYLKLRATEGNFYAGSSFSSKKIITPTFFIDGVETPLDGLSCYWFVQDASITPTSANYSRFGGTGWRLLEVDETNHSLEILKDDIKTSLVYKAVVLYNDSSVSQTIKIENLNSKIKLKVKTKSDVIIQGGGDVFFDVDVTYCDGETKGEGETLVYNFSRYDYQGIYLDNNFFDWVKKNEKVVKDNDTIYSSEIKFNSSLILNGVNTIACSVYLLTGDGTTLLGTETLAIVTTVSTDYILSMQNSDYLYKYDADGDSPTCEAYDGPISSMIKVINPLSFKIYKKDGTEFNESEYGICHTTWELPVNSLMDFTFPAGITPVLSEDGKYYIITGSGVIDIPYIIKSRYDIKKNDNTARLTVECDREGHIVKGTTNLLFSKDGEAGTNGTKYAALITYMNYPYGVENTSGIPHKFQLVWDVTRGNWFPKDPFSNRVHIHEADQSGNIGEFTGIPLDVEAGFKVKIFSDGEEILDPTSYGIPEWSLFDARYIRPYFSIDTTENKLVADSGWTDPTETKACILQAKIKVSNSGTMESKKDLYIYAYYPIEISRVSTITEDMPVPVMDNGFNTVLYHNDGSNPKYNNAEPFHCIDGLYNDDFEDLYDYQWSSSQNLIVVDSNITGPECEIKPKDKYDNGDSNNYIKASLVASQQVIDKVNLQITYLAGRTELIQDNIDYKSSILNYLQNLSQYYFYEDWEENILQSEVLALREVMIATSKNSLGYLEDFLDCFTGETSYQYSTVYYNRKYRVEGALRELKDLISTASLSDLISFDDSIFITLTDSDKETITNDLGIGTLSQVELAIKAFNDAITSYEIDYNKIRTAEPGDVSNLHVNYSQIKSYIESRYLDDLVTTNEDEFGGFKAYLETIKTKLTTGENIVSKKDYEDILSEIHNASQFYIEDYNILNSAILNQYDTTEDQAELLSITAEKEGYEKQLASIAALSPMIHLKPIVFTLNRYGYSYLNEWDGNKIYVKEDGSYILSPLVGAGKKEDDNTYTGLLMGTVRENDNNTLTEKIGLIGLHHGERSIFLDAETGRAEFGKSGAGQIIMDPSTNGGGKIFGGEYVESSSTEQGSGMLIDLAKPEIKFGTGRFSVDEYGNVHIGGGNGDNDLGGWDITDHSIESVRTEGQNYKGIVLESGDLTALPAIKPNIHSNEYNNLSASNKDGFYLGDDGIGIGENFTFTNNTLTLGDGTRKWIVSTNGDPQTVTNSYLGCNTNSLSDTTSESVYVGTDGIRLGNKFKVTSNGILKLGYLSGNFNWTIDGDSGKSYIAYNSDKYAYPDTSQADPPYSDSPIYAPSTSVYLGTDGIRLGNKFYVDNTGSLTTKKGKIADFVIQDDALFISVKNQSDIEINNKINPDETINTRNVFVGEDGIRLGNVEVIKNEQEEIIGRKFKFKVGNDGELICTKGTIAGWNIGENKISVSDNDSSLELNRNGEISASWTNPNDPNIRRSWRLGKDGTITANALTINGGSITIQSSGTVFSVSSSGQLQCTGAQISGHVESNTGSVGGFTIANGALYTNSKATINTQGDGVHLSADGIAIGDTFKVTDDGNIDAESGTIGGITLDSNGLTVLNKFRIGKSGTIQCSAIDCTGGTIGCFTVSQGTVEIGQLATFTDNNVSIGGFTFSTNLMINSSGMAQVDIGKFASLYLGNDLVSTETISYDSGSGIRTITVLKI